MKGYKWDYREIKSMRKIKPSEKDIDYLYNEFVKTGDLRNSIKKALKENAISTDFNLRSYIHHVNRIDSYKVLIEAKKETYTLNCVRVMDLLERGFINTEIALITGLSYAVVFNITNK